MGSRAESRPLAKAARDLAHIGGFLRAARNTHLAGLRIAGRLWESHAARGRVADGQLRVLAHVPSYIPRVRGGSERTLHEVLLDLRRRGHEVQVACTGEAFDGTVEGIAVQARPTRPAVRDLYLWSDVVITQLKTRDAALRLAAIYSRPLVHFVHVGTIDQRRTFGRADLVVFCSQFVQAQHPWIRDAIVVHPPINLADYETEPGDAFTLVNLSELKGAPVFYALARALPDRQFLGVRSWGEQLIPDPVPSNVEILDPVVDMREVYGRTRLLLVPSRYESYGRVAIEAAASGIPTIAHPTGGLREALGTAGVFVDRDDLPGWIRAIRQLDDPARYAGHSKDVLARARSLDSRRELDEFERALLGAAARAARSR